MRLVDLFWLIAICVAFPVEVSLDQTLRFKVITCNVRTDTKWRFYHEHRWQERKMELIKTISKHSSDRPTIIGFQELKHNQLKDIEEGLNSLTSTKDWKYYGIGRDDGKKKGEYAPIFYQNSKWELLNATTKWLSETPDVPSKSWGAANVRIVTITTFRSLETGVHVNILNTHYDHMSELARGKSSELIIKYMNEIPNSYQSILTGDFNSISTDASYQTLIKDLSDTRENSGLILSTLDTYTGFEPEDHYSVIDFIWCNKKVNIHDAKTFVHSYNVIDTWTVEGFRFSDHRPVIADIEIKR